MEKIKYLLNDVYSVFREKYGSAGDEVTIISDNGNVLIVENKEGNRYSVKTADVGAGKIEIEIEKPAEDKTIINRVQPKKVIKKAAPLNNQSSLF